MQPLNVSAISMGLMERLLLDARSHLPPVCVAGMVLQYLPREEELAKTRVNEGWRDLLARLQ